LKQHAARYNNEAVEFRFKNKFEKLLYLVGFIIRNLEVLLERPQREITIQSKNVKVVIILFPWHKELHAVRSRIKHCDVVGCNNVNASERLALGKCSLSRVPESRMQYTVYG
jgi:hypothetical protein